MSKKYAIIALLFLTTGLFILLQPHISSRIVPFQQNQQFNLFLESVRRSDSIDAKAFWQFREYYSPGAFTFDKNGLSSSILKQNNNSLQTFLNSHYTGHVFLKFESPDLTSIEALSQTNNLKLAINPHSLDQKDILFSKNNESIYRDHAGKIYIIFLKPISEMKEANGFFQYNDSDKILLKNTYWLELTVLK